MIRSLTLATVMLVTAAGALHAQTSAPAAPVALPGREGPDLQHSLLGSGQRRAALLLHGTGGEGARWMPNIKGLSSDFHVFAIDQIGFGASDKPLTIYHSGVMAEFAAGFLKAVGIERATVGQSMGAGVALYMAVHYRRWSITSCWSTAAACGPAVPGPQAELARQADCERRHARGKPRVSQAPLLRRQPDYRSDGRRQPDPPSQVRLHD